MPALVLQPLVENAVFHGVALLPGGGTVGISVRGERGRVVATVLNPRARGGVRGEGSRMALANIEQRLRALYGERAGLRADIERDVYRVELSFPAERVT